MLVGYSRVSTDEQNLDLQIDALKIAGCKKFFKDIGSCSSIERNFLK
jgi:DNA invertase Pin-like site-specific DNA recombinase